MTIGDLPEPITEEQDGVGIRDAFSRLYVAALADYQTRGSLRQPSALN